jgi:hypothetical protein
MGVEFGLINQGAFSTQRSFEAQLKKEQKEGKKRNNTYRNHL